MRTEEFNFDLPENLIAQSPIEKRDDSRMLTVDRVSGEIEHKRFYEISEMLEKGDTLVLNDTKVIPARLYGKKKATGGKVELLLVAEEKEKTWLVMARPAKKLKVGTTVIFNEGLLEGTVTEEREEGLRLINFQYTGDFYAVLDQLGEMPLPPYIGKTLQNPDRYQTIYSKNLGSVAAPTAGLHFTEEVIEELENKGINIVYITLHVGLGTFKPVEAENILDHKMHAEFYHITSEVAEIINKTRNQGNRVIAVGTTSCRTLESIAGKEGKVEAGNGWTDIFIYPGYRFRGIDGLITNFHLPKSTLIMLVSAFAGRENTMNAYKEAIEQKYRFYSFGDAMFIK
ncbi:tRNA preQ1(34) S-adenosylmethionine ribosyltransferase-isomerase QueA [Isachenkonia alkalipeptolytica]|uniref:S-adenosylmethionine:tRNA ribosyltransferase-isomerase n=1 Tax=Isachenkonia alkalipeptolytica TaxID=2565777 RepID=A0AA44BF87_9CLOT|nr:tRNA preQ1(34) S-adenosylmethionine ribosyltransferase-isomerase QueA [Isachenkonia alkalipeptolytica]NBG88920.1 tRNA preQ1(34) S-adenosylmethionine ribosyltransferase-isomerase QueA [Isachenkonia alkalipeptolytica]